MIISKMEYFVSWCLYLVVLVILLQGFGVEAGKKNAGSVIVINTGGGGC